MPNSDSAPVFHLIYRSKSCMPKADTEKGLSEIFSKARRNNKAAGITGALMNHEDRFAQVLEGPEPEVRSLFERIKGDKRHEAVEIRKQGIVPERAFERWAMAEVLDQGDVDLPMLATAKGLAEAAPWKVTQEQKHVLAELRLLTRGYGKGS